jgi:phospholipid/cholesterol/gamma-HCH transport system substrate-binding protein
MAELEIKPTASMIQRVAAVILSSMVMVGVLVWLLTGGGVGLLARKVDTKTYMPDATGLEAGGPVRLNGIQVGKVKNIAISGYLDRQRAVRVILRLETKFLPKIPADSITSIGSDTLIGNKFVDIAAGKETTTVGEGSELRSELADTAADKADLIYGLQDSLRKVNSMLVDVASPATPIGHYIVGEVEYDQMLRSVDVFEKGMRSLAALSTPAGQVVFTTTMYATWDKSLRQIDDTMQSIQRGEGAAGHLYVSDDQYNTILGQVRELRKSVAQFRADMAKAGPGLRDAETYNKITRMLAATDAMISALNRGEGKAGELKDFDRNPQKYLRVKVF